jgi:hypothetical protein
MARCEIPAKTGYHGWGGTPRGPSAKATASVRLGRQGQARRLYRANLAMVIEIDLAAIRRSTNMKR